MKKLKLLLTSILCSTLLLTGCNTTKSQHQHTFGEWTEVTAATCTGKGSKERVCECGEKEIEEIPALGHDLIHHDGQAPTCIESGYAEYDTCSRCDYSSYTAIPATGHQHTATREENRTEADCTHDGFYVLVTYCTDDNVDISRENKTIPALGHLPGDWEISVEATDLHDGERVKKCQRCQEVLETEVIKFYDAAKAATDFNTNFANDGYSFGAVWSEEYKEYDLTVNFGSSSDTTEDNLKSAVYTLECYLPSYMSKTLELYGDPAAADYYDYFGVGIAYYYRSFKSVDDGSSAIILGYVYSGKLYGQISIFDNIE